MSERKKLIIDYIVALTAMHLIAIFVLELFKAHSFVNCTMIMTFISLVIAFLVPNKKDVKNESN